jgi:hypothetical protein
MKKHMMTLVAAGLCICLMAACGSSGKKETEAAAETKIAVQTEKVTESETEKVTETETETEAVTETESETEPETEAAPAETEEALGEGEALFISEDMRFSFRYDEAHTANLTDEGAAELALNGDDSLVGLFVSVVRADGLPQVDQLIDDEMMNETQRYLNNMAVPPEKKELEIDGHQLRGYTYAYSDEEGKTVAASYYVEVREGRGIFYRTAEYYESDNAAAQEALEKAVSTLKFKN